LIGSHSLPSPLVTFSDPSYREVKAPPREQALEPTDEEVPLKIHSPLEERDTLRKSVSYRKQDHNTITTQREIACYDVEKEAYDPRF
jgi:hypothetical protein